MNLSSNLFLQFLDPITGRLHLQPGDVPQVCLLACSIAGRVLSVNMMIMIIVLSANLIIL